VRGAGAARIPGWGRDHLLGEGPQCELQLANVPVDAQALRLPRPDAQVHHHIPAQTGGHRRPREADLLRQALICFALAGTQGPPSQLYALQRGWLVRTMTGALRWAPLSHCVRDSRRARRTACRRRKNSKPVGCSRCAAEPETTHRSQRGAALVLCPSSSAFARRIMMVACASSESQGEAAFQISSRLRQSSQASHGCCVHSSP
jgi:hypothetical protein